MASTWCATVHAWACVHLATMHALAMRVGELLCILAVLLILRG